MRVPFFADLVEGEGLSPSDGSIVAERRLLPWMIGVLVWLMLVTGLAKPQQVGEPIVRTEAARDIMLAVDISGSMDYVDFESEQGRPERRLDVVKRVVGEFVDTRSEDRVGLIVFGRKAYLQMPFTRDLTTAGALLELVDVGMAGPHTAVGDAIGLAIKSFERSEQEKRLLILLTDGNDTASKMSPINAAHIAETSGVEIFTIGVGDPEANGEDKVDFDMLRGIAEKTGGSFFVADDEAALAAVYQRIDAMVPAEAKTESWRPRHSMVHYPLGVILIVATLGLAWLMLTGRRAS